MKKRIVKKYNCFEEVGCTKVKTMSTKEFLNFVHNYLTAFALHVCYFYHTILLFYGFIYVEIEEY